MEVLDEGVLFRFGVLGFREGFILDLMLLEFRIY